MQQIHFMPFVCLHNMTFGVNKQQLLLCHCWVWYELTNQPLLFTHLHNLQDFMSLSAKLLVKFMLNTSLARIKKHIL